MTGIIIISLVVLAIIQVLTILVMRWAIRATNHRITNLVNTNAEVYANFKLRLDLLNTAFKHLNCIKKELANDKKPEQTDETNAPETSKPRTKKKTTKIKDK